MVSNTLLKIENLSKSFGENTVLKDINLELNEGEILGLVGENGAGKSTLMKIIFGMDVIRETGGYNGKISFEGKEVNFASPFEALNAGIGMVHQEFSLIPGFKVSENIVLNRESIKNNVVTHFFGDSISKIDQKENLKRTQEAISKLGVNLTGQEQISEMAVAYKQFTEIAREIEREHTKLLVLDEPTAVLTEDEAEIFMPCPDKKTKELLNQIKPFVPNGKVKFKKVMCCGMGGGAKSKEPELAKEMMDSVKSEINENIYTYCASCSASFGKSEVKNVKHILSEMLGVKEKVDLGYFKNSLKLKYYKRNRK